jgi:hypothetical protein
MQAQKWSLCPTRATRISSHLFLLQSNVTFPSTPAIHACASKKCCFTLISVPLRAAERQCSRAATVPQRHDAQSVRTSAWRDVAGAPPTA